MATKHAKHLGPGMLDNDDTCQGAGRKYMGQIGLSGLGSLLISNCMTLSRSGMMMPSTL
jgi:hypothetical protein